MNVKCKVCEKPCSFRKENYDSDYAALLSRHNTLREAVKKERVACEQIGGAIFDEDVSWAKADDAYYAARAEVDRLLGES